MASTATSSTTDKKKSNLLLPIVGLLLLAGANAGFWFYRIRGSAPQMPKEAAACKTSNDPSMIENVALAPFLANLSAGEGYVKITITLSRRKSPERKGKSDDATGPSDLNQSALVRDTILSDLSTQESSILLTTEGRAALKRKLKTDLEAKIPNLDLENIYFTDFLVQQ
jgi:flagellar basal body-associated protein FliL